METSTTRTNLENWVADEVFPALYNLQEILFDWLPHVKNLYLVLPESGDDRTHYEYHGFFYPLARETVFLPWREAKEGSLIYSTTHLEAIEKEVHFEDIRNGRLEPSHPGSVFPEVRLVVPDYEGRVKRGVHDRV